MARVFTDAGAMKLASANTKLFGADVFACAFWINRTAAPAAERGLMGAGDFASDFGWWLNLTATGLVKAIAPYATVAKARTSSTATTLNAWTHVVVNYLLTGLNSTDFTFFINGKAEAGTSVSNGSGAAPSNSATPFFVGPSPGTDTTAVTSAPPAQIGQIAVWNRPLTGAEALALAAGEHPSNFPEGLIEIFDMDSSLVEEGEFQRMYLVPTTNPTFALSPAIVAPYRIAPRIVLAGTNNILTAGLGDLQLTGFAPSLDQKINAALGALTLTGFAPALDQKINAALGQLVLTGFAPSLNNQINAAVGQLVLNGFAASPVIGTNLVAQLGSLDLTGFAPSVDVTTNISILAGLGQLLIEGFAPEITGQDATQVAGTGPTGDRRMALMQELRELQQTLAQEKEPQHKGFRDERVVKRRKQIESALLLEQKREAAKLAAEVAAENEDEEGLLGIILNFLGGSDVS